MESLPLPPVPFLSSVGPGGESVYSYVLDKLTGNREVSVLLSKGVITSGPKPRADSLVWKVQAGWQVWAESQRESVSSEPAASGGQLGPVSPAASTLYHSTTTETSTPNIVERCLGPSWPSLNDIE